MRRFESRPLPWLHPVAQTVRRSIIRRPIIVFRRFLASALAGGSPGADRVGSCGRSSGAPRLDFVFTVCDKAAGEVCPTWPGQPMTAHWGIEDPATFAGPEDKMRATFRNALVLLSRRIELPIEKLDRMSLQNRLSDIGKT